MNVVFAFISPQKPTHEQILLAAQQDIVLYHIGDADAFTITPAWVKSKAPTIIKAFDGVVVVHPVATLRLCKDYLIGVFKNANRAPTGIPPQFEAKSFHVYNLTK